MSAAWERRPGNALTRSHVAARLSISCLAPLDLLRGTVCLISTAHHLVMKRSREVEDEVQHPAKVRRVANVDRLSGLSDELLIRILSFLPVSSLLTCQR